MIDFKKNHKTSYTMKIDNKNDLLNLIKYLENIQISEPMEILHNEKVYKLLVNLTETSNNIKFDNQKMKITLELDVDDVEDWVYALKESLIKKEFNPAELYTFDLNGKPIDTYMTVTFD